MWWRYALFYLVKEIILFNFCFKFTSHTIFLLFLLHLIILSYLFTSSFLTLIISLSQFYFIKIYCIALHQSHLIILFLTMKWLKNVIMFAILVTSKIDSFIQTNFTHKSISWLFLFKLGLKFTSIIFSTSTREISTVRLFSLSFFFIIIITIIIVHVIFTYLLLLMYVVKSNRTIWKFSSNKRNKSNKYDWYHFPDFYDNETFATQFISFHFILFYFSMHFLYTDFYGFAWEIFYPEGGQQ